VLQTLREVRSGHRLLTVFGCGGARDRTKRPVMGKTAVELSDHAFVTSDNPRTENPDAIIAEIVAGMKGGSPYTVEPDRKKAIFAAIRAAQPGDLVLIAGKGHEDYQIIADPAAPGGTRKIHFDDREVATQALLDTAF
jgi:UDP-N-acetylmuramoyl-L-alanyl-D-glutamate--2,6-diaminopimelate ligase